MLFRHSLSLVTSPWERYFWAVYDIDDDLVREEFLSNGSRKRWVAFYCVLVISTSSHAPYVLRIEWMQYYMQFRQIKQLNAVN